MDNNQPVENKSTEPKVGLRELKVTIISADDNVFNGTVYMITSVNKDGEFDILPLHTNFITLIKDKIILHKTNGEKQEITITNGVLKVVENKIDIILGPFIGADILPENMLEPVEKGKDDKKDEKKTEPTQETKEKSAEKQAAPE